jgi:hypothetical protein
MLDHKATATAARARVTTLLFRAHYQAALDARARVAALLAR